MTTQEQREYEVYVQAKEEVEEEPLDFESFVDLNESFS